MGRKSRISNRRQSPVRSRRTARLRLLGIAVGTVMIVGAGWLIHRSRSTPNADGGSGHRSRTIAGKETFTFHGREEREVRNKMRPDTTGGADQTGSEAKSPHGSTLPKKSATDSSGSGGSFLNNFGGASGTAASPADSSAQSSTDLEAQFLAITKSMDELSALKSRVMAALVAGDRDTAIALRTRGQKLTAGLNPRLTKLETDLHLAKAERPNDPVVSWLTGELLMSVGGEPKDILPYLSKAVAGGLKRSRLFASLALAQLESNQFRAAYLSAVKSLAGAGGSRRVWETYSRCALGWQQFPEAINQFDKSFPGNKPEWVERLRKQAAELETMWRTEQTQRQADARADNLPRVRFTIEHQRFVHTANGSTSAKTESTGRGAVEIELFEDQTPATVANFLVLVSKGFYDGTRFSVAESARMVRGGDPLTKNSDPLDDGDGGPGYVVPDEFSSSRLRGFFRGTVGMVNTGPHTAGSQFFITLVPTPRFNGHFTAFGRVIRGQEVIDAITPGRTNRNIGRFGRIVPGDVLVHAEVIRKRDHPYRVVKERPSR